MQVQHVFLLMMEKEIVSMPPLQRDLSIQLEPGAVCEAGVHSAPPQRHCGTKPLVSGMNTVVGKRGNLCIKPRDRIQELCCLVLRGPSHLLAFGHPVFRRDWRAAWCSQ